MDGTNKSPSTNTCPYMICGRKTPGIQHEHFRASSRGTSLEKIVGFPFVKFDAAIYRGISASPIFLVRISTPFDKNKSMIDFSNVSIEKTPLRVRDWGSCAKSRSGTNFEIWNASFRDSASRVRPKAIYAPTIDPTETPYTPSGNTRSWVFESSSNAPTNNIPFIPPPPNPSVRNGLDILVVRVSTNVASARRMGWTRRTTSKQDGGDGTYYRTNSS